MKLVIAGNPVDGFAFHGPFPQGSEEDVSGIDEWAERALRGKTWWIADLAAPLGCGTDFRSSITSFPSRPARARGAPRPPTFVGTHTLTRTKHTPVALPNGGFDYRPDGQESACFDVYVDVPMLVKRIGWHAANNRDGETALHRGAVVVKMRKE